MKIKETMCLALLLFSMVVQAQDLKIVVNNKGKVGFADKDGTVVINYQYDSAQPFKDGISIVSKSDKQGIIDERGNVLLPLKYSRISKWTDNIFLIKDGKKMGLADKSGTILLQAKYSHISRPNCYGKALIAAGGKAQPVDNDKYMALAKYGVVDSNGRICIEPKYTGLYEFTFQGKGKNPYFEGERLEFTYHPLSDTLKTDCEYVGYGSPYNIFKAGILDGQGNVILKLGLYDQVMKPKDGMVRYYITKKKETTCGYHNLSSGNGFVVSKIKNAMANINYSTHGDFACGMAPVYDKTWHFIDKNNTVLRKDYEQIVHSQELGLWAAKNSSGTWDVFDEQNNEVSALSGFGDIIFPNSKQDKELFCVQKNDMYGVITKNGASIVPFEYEEMRGNRFNTICVKKNGKWGVLDINGSQMVPTEFAGLIYSSEYDSRNFWVMKSDSLYYNYNIDKKAILTRGYKSVTNFKNGVALVIPTDVKIEDNAINRALLVDSNTSAKVLESIKPSDYKKSFGRLIKEDDTVLFERLVSVKYLDKVVDRLVANGLKPFTNREQKDLILELTLSNRTYDAKSTLTEDEWNY